jgi:hypothetical protein
MSKKIGLTKNVQVRQNNSYSRLRASACLLILLPAIFIMGCQKENSAGTKPAPVISANITTADATNYDIDAPPLYLGTAAGFTILAETGISTTGVTSITGNIGVSPIASIGITGFGLIKDASGEFSRSTLVIGKIFASNYTAPTPSRMTTAVSDMQTAFTKANDRIHPAPLVNKYAGNISGRTLPPGLYKWGTGVLVTNAGVTLSGLADDVWVFQIAKNLTIENSAIITLKGGAQAKNIFWVVSGKAMLGTAVRFIGNILSKTLISLNAGTKVRGRLLAQTAVTIIASDVSPQ